MSIEFFKDKIRAKDKRSIINFYSSNKLDDELYEDLDNALCESYNTGDVKFIDSLLRELILEVSFNNLILSRLMLSYLYESNKDDLVATINSVVNNHKDKINEDNLFFIMVVVFIEQNIKVANEVKDQLVLKYGWDKFIRLWSFFMSRRNLNNEEKEEPIVLYFNNLIRSNSQYECLLTQVRQ